MSRFRKRVRHGLEYGLVRLARGLDHIMGPQVSAALASVLGRFVYRRLRIRADVVEDQLRHAYPDRDDAWIRTTAEEAYAHLGREAMMLIRLSRLGPEAVIEVTEVEGLDGLRAAVESGRGVIMVSGHYGNWEVCGSAIAARGIPLDAVARPQDNPLTDRLVNRARERLGMTVVPTGGATKETLRALRAGRAVGLVADQDARQRGAFVPFFGRPASTHRGPAVLALRAGAPMFLATATRRPDGVYQVRLDEVAVPDVDDPERRERELTAAWAGALEAVVRKDPTQYLWHHRRWKTAPPKEPAGNGPPPPSV